MVFVERMLWKTLEELEQPVDGCAEAEKLIYYLL